MYLVFSSSGRPKQIKPKIRNLSFFRKELIILETDIFSEDKALFFLDAGSLTTSFWRSVADEDQDEKSPKCAVG